MGTKGHWLRGSWTVWSLLTSHPSPTSRTRRGAKRGLTPGVDGGVTTPVPDPSKTEVLKDKKKETTMWKLEIGKLAEEAERPRILHDVHPIGSAAPGSGGAAGPRGALDTGQSRHCSLLLPRGRPLPAPGLPWATSRPGQVGGGGAWPGTPGMARAASQTPTTVGHLRRASDVGGQDPAQWVGEVTTRE